MEVVCKNCGNIFKTFPSKIKIGRGVFCSNKCKWENTQNRMIGNDYWKKTVDTQFKKGHTLWRKASVKSFGSLLYKKWVDKIKKEDKKCKLCKSEKSLVVHHIKNRFDYPELLMERYNVITLCRACHMSIHRPRSSRNTKK